MNHARRWLYVVVSAAPPVLQLDDFLTALNADGWAPCVIATPTAAAWTDLAGIADTTGCPVRVHPQPPRQQGDSLPQADAVVAAPITFNSINKWAAGFSDNLALGILNEMLGTDVPMIAAPCVKPILQQHPAYTHSIARLTKAGVIMLDPDAITTRAPDDLAAFRWDDIIAALTKAAKSKWSRADSSE